MCPQNIINLLGKPLSVINIGLSSMAEGVREQGVEVIQLDWNPPSRIVPRLIMTQAGIDIEVANQEVCTRIKQGRPYLIGMGLAKDVIPGMHDRMILHAGPPITWDRMCGPQRGAIMGSLIYEGIAENADQALKLASSGDIEFAPCHQYHAVGPMAGIISPQMPVFIIENKTFGNYAYCNLNEGLGKRLRYGAMGPDVYSRLHWMKNTLFPILDRAIASIQEGIDIRFLIAQALHMGDEGHNRHKAGNSLFIRTIGPSLIRLSQEREETARVFEFMDENDHFFLNMAMPAGKSMLEPAENVPGSSIVTVMARNGTDFGIKISSMPDQWFIAPAGKVEGLYLPGFSEQDANPDIGDSTITETAGYGGMAMAAAPAITSFIGGTAQLALNATMEMYEITFDEHDAFTIPALNYRGTPLGIDIRKVIETGILPRINTGIAHKEPGIGMVGAGILRAPEDCFQQAFDALAAH